MTHFYDRILLFFVLIFCLQTVSAQNGFRSGPEQGWGIGWNNTDFWVGTGFGTTFGKTYQNNLGSGNRFFRLYTDWSGQQLEHGPNGSSDIPIIIGSTTSLQAGNNKAYYINVSNSSNRYVFRTRFGDGISNVPQLTVFEVEGEIQDISLVTQSPTMTAVTSTSNVNVTAYLTGNLSQGQGVYLRYSSDNWSSSSVVPMSGSNVTYNALIPAQAAGITVKYYVFTSGSGLTISHNDADFYTINGHNNSGSNYQYTVLAGNSTVSLVPTYPNDQQSVTLTFDATGTALEDTSNIYLHSGVSVSESNPLSFQYTKGNWGQNDGVGAMTNISGNIWSITFPSLRTFYNVPADKDIFGLNLLFRNANGTIKEDLDGANYHFSVDPGDYFNITFPTNNTHFALVGLNVTHSSVANIIPDSWVLKEIDPLTNIEISTLYSQLGSLNFSYEIPTISAGLRKFKVIVDFNGTIKYKTFFIQGYNPVVESPRPTWTKPGINYHDGDLTKATLVLHAPTYTRYKKGNGTVSGSNNTNPKENVFVIGDFNDWIPSETYKLNRDRDGWDGVTDLDSDNDRGDYWWIELSGLIPNQEYVFQYLIDGVLQIADPYTNKVSDPDDNQIPSNVYPSLIAYLPQAFRFAFQLN